jgi:carboxyl-terminal processing protease
MLKSTSKTIIGFCACLFLFASVTTGAEERFGGVGLRIEAGDGGLVVLDVMDGTDAQAKGVQRGDVIIKINQAATQGVDFGTLVGRLRGPVDSEVTLEIRRVGAPQPIIFRLKRAEIVYPG